jgi:hypothetical protein
VLNHLNDRIMNSLNTGNKKALPTICGERSQSRSSSRYFCGGELLGAGCGTALVTGAGRGAIRVGALVGTSKSSTGALVDDPGAAGFAPLAGPGVEGAGKAVGARPGLANSFSN